ncbi:MAG TPA: DUF1549 domain-containing protein, partial [Gemmataceae bacterium]|nr:DUF1549 domain-containing protein [Gemmataceae bacterium]
MKHLFSFGCVCVILAAASARAARAEEAKKAEFTPPPARDIRTIEAFPPSVTLNGQDDSAQLVLTGKMASRDQDLTGSVTYAVSDPKIAKVTPHGRVIPLADGKTEIVAQYGDKSSGKSIKIAVACAHMTENLPINFGNQIVPIFTKLGCNGGGCHGKSGGQNGFALSLLGFVPELDYQTLVKENRGRRLFPANPEHSLLLLKATGTMAHGGGKRMEVGSDEYKLVRRWIASSAPFGSEKDPTVVKVTVYPENRILTRNNVQQFSVIAHYSDGSTLDVTQRAQYESNDQEIAIVDGAGLVRTLGLSGDAGIMARYQANVAVFRATVPLGVKIPTYAFEERTVVDRFTKKKWEQLGVVPSDLSSDEQFLRRVSLDLTGTLPTPAKIKTFMENKDPQKRDKLIDELLESPEYSYLFANKWADILRVKRRGQPDRASGTFAFHTWIREAIAKDMPYDRFVREILAATGDESQSPTAVWYKELTEPQQFVDDTAQLFLGLRLACAQCHHH